VITTKRGRPGGQFDYSNSFRIDKTGARPNLQRVYGRRAWPTIGSFFYFGAPYPTALLFR
jgi:hypothetical protein